MEDLREKVLTKQKEKINSKKGIVIGVLIAMSALMIFTMSSTPNGITLSGIITTALAILLAYVIIGLVFNTNLKTIEEGIIKERIVTDKKMIYAIRSRTVFIYYEEDGVTKRTSTLFFNEYDKINVGDKIAVFELGNKNTCVKMD